MEKYTRTSSSTSQHEAQYHSIINASHPDSTSKRRRLSTRRKLALLLVALSFALFCVLLFPVYFTLPRYHHGSSGTSLNSSSTSTVVAAQSATTSGAVRKQAVKFTDLNDFRIEYYSSGQNNSKVLKGGLPALLSLLLAPPPLPQHTQPPPPPLQLKPPLPHPPPPPLSPPGSVLSILYPAHSYTPSAHPVGGTQFYALTPFDLTLASSVTLNYSVFLPAYYDFVLGGKMPGLYGGTEGCGGGNDASDCWSTRMAWRTAGAGELYAYWPQDKQNTTALLEVPPYSYVNADYGISLGRGSFNYSKAGWTDISQTVTLQTNKTHPNGVVEIAVNGSTVIYYDQVYYPTTIKGILFSTFFGGATSDWATPVDQYSYFRDFSVRINGLRSSKKRSTTL